MNRIAKELKRFRQDPPPHVLKAHVRDSDQRVLHFLVAGPAGSDFEGGQYVVRMDLPETYPFAAPLFKFMTPNGRFKAGSHVCISGLSGHHMESWTPMQNFTSILVGIVSFMLELPQGELGAEVASSNTMARLARDSAAWNSQHGYDSMFDSRYAWTRAAAAKREDLG